jgi:hypothetical protein
MNTKGWYTSWISLRLQVYTLDSPFMLCQSLAESTIGKDVLRHGLWTPDKPNQITLELQNGLKVIYRTPSLASIRILCSQPSGIKSSYWCTHDELLSPDVSVQNKFPALNCLHPKYSKGAGLIVVRCRSQLRLWPIELVPPFCLGWRLVVCHRWQIL